ncbi:Transcription termination factor like [Actinidia chinensis var. chinensis]|uniref:Transcription termination factor like n=1 Tax=Actinidia chinensis var. chinensis TaxID=1590841 RepID=A0A2R6QPH8_ACTCC|nr:Transcription termination factor like [Actinidia chinensis var. chinensis]
MHFHPPATPFLLYTIFSRHFSSATKLPTLPNLSKIPSKYKPQAINQAQKALTDYLHTTRSLPYLYAENISKNSIFSLSDAVAKVEFSPSTFFKSFQRFLRYHPINEFEFFYESIGINYDEINSFLPPNKFFLCEDLRVLNVACALSGFGFPWNSLGKFYTEEVLIFGRDPVELSKNLNGFKEYGFSNVTVIGICLVFPYVLGGKPELGSEIDALFDDLRRVFVDFDLVSCVEGNVDAWVEVCRKIRVFYDLGCEKGKMGELMGRRKTVFLRYPEEVLVKQAEFFSRLSVSKSDVGLLILEKPEILDFDLEDRVISVLGLLKHFGMNRKELRSIAEEYPYVVGRNKMANLPHVMRAMNLHEWFFAMMKVGNHCQLGTYVIGDPNEDLDTDYASSIEKIQFLRTPVHTLGKLDFLHSIGFGENNLTIKVLENLHGTSAELQERFECLLGAGIQFSKLCKIIRLSPKILSQNSETLVQKIKFLCEGMGFSLQYLDVFPTYLCYDLEKRIKPRYRFHVWLTEKGLCKKTYSPASMISTSEKNFLARISGMNPAAPKKWLEFISKQNHGSDCQGCNPGINVERPGTI